MQVLEKILQEIEDFKKQKFSVIHPMNIDAIGAWCCDKIAEIIRSHMEDEPVSNPYKLDDGWIPVEERLPEPGVYLVSCDDKEDPVKRMRMKGICFYDHNGIYDGEVYAWQPLPAPYKPKEEKR